MIRLARVWNVVLTHFGLSFCVYLFLCAFFIKKFLMRIKATEGDYLPRDPSDNTDMGGKAGFLGQIAALLFVPYPFYRPFFYLHFGRKIRKLYGGKSVWQTDLLGCWLPLCLFAAVCILAAIGKPDAAVLTRWQVCLLSPCLLSEAIACFRFHRIVKRNYYEYEVRSD